MNGCTGADGSGLRGLRTPARNHYFYGKLMDVAHFQMEQTYMNHKRWLLNRLTLGYGVACGLDVVLTADGQRVVVTPGAAIDAMGREIIVPAESPPIDPRQLTDDCGRAVGEPRDDLREAWICLDYHECETELVPVLVAECETTRECAPSTICERYRVLVRETLEVPPRPASLLPERPALDAEGRLSAESYRQLVDQLRGPCATVPGHPCVPLARLERVAAGGWQVHPDVRPLVLGNQLLHGLLLSLLR